MTLYNKDQEYNLKVVNTAGETKEIKYTPNKDMSKPEMIMALKAKYKNFFKLIESKDTYTSYEEPYVGKKMTKAQWEEIYNTEIEHNKDKGGWETFEDWWKDMTEKSKLIESENTDIISKLNSLKDEFMSNLYRDKDKANEVKNQIKQVLQDAPDGTEMCRVVQDTSSGWTSHGSYSHTYTVIKTLKKENDVWEMYGRKKENLDDAVSSIVFNEGILMTRAEAEKEKEKQKVNDTLSHRDIVNVGKDSAGNSIGKSTNRVDYPNKKEESYGETKYEVSSYYGKDFKGLEDSLNTNNYDEVETFIWEKLQNGNTVECTDTETGDRKRYSPETHEYGDETFGIEDYIVESKYDYKKVNKAMSGIEKILKQNGYNLTHDDINLETDNNGEIHVYDKLTGDEVLVVTQDMLRNILTEATLDGSVIVISYGKGTRFPDRDTAIRYYEDCVAGTDRNSSENYAYQNILYSLKSTDKPVVYDIDDDTEYDWWVQKGKPTEDISDELLKAHLGESKDMKKEDLSDRDIKELDEYTDNEIKKMYDDYCSENSECKSFEEWQKENVDSAMINELEYEFFSNRKKTESSDIDEKVVTDGFVGQPLSMLLTYLGDGHDIADKDYDSVVFFPPVDEIDDADNYDLYVQGLSQILNVVEPFDFNDVVIVVNLADYVTANKDTLLDLFEVDGETDEEIMEDLVCRVMPSVISGYTTDNVYKILLSTVKGGK